MSTPKFNLQRATVKATLPKSLAPFPLAGRTVTFNEIDPEYYLCWWEIPRDKIIEFFDVVMKHIRVMEAEPFSYTIRAKNDNFDLLISADESAIFNKKSTENGSRNDLVFMETAEVTNEELLTLVNDNRFDSGDGPDDSTKWCIEIFLNADYVDKTVEYFWF